MQNLLEYFALIIIFKSLNGTSKGKPGNMSVKLIIYCFIGLLIYSICIGHVTDNFRLQKPRLNYDTSTHRGNHDQKIKNDDFMEIDPSKIEPVDIQSHNERVSSGLSLLQSFLDILNSNVTNKPKNNQTFNAYLEERMQEISKIFRNNTDESQINKTFNVNLEENIQEISRIIQNLLNKNESSDLSNRIGVDEMENFPYEVPKCKELYCTDKGNYPTNFVLNAMKENTGIVLLNDKISYSDSEDSDVSLRMGISDNNDKEMPLCESVEQVVFPTSGLNINSNEWNFIANAGKYTQSIKVEVCRNENSKCKIIEGLGYGYEAYCKQTFVIRELVTVKEDKSLGIGPFKFPASCCCHIKFNFLPEYRSSFSTIMNSNSTNDSIKFPKV